MAEQPKRKLKTPDPLVFVGQVRETWIALRRDHPDSRIRELFVCCPSVDAYAKAYGWPATLIAMASGIESAPSETQESA